MAGDFPRHNHDGAKNMSAVTNDQNPELREYEVEYEGYWNWSTTVMATSPEKAYEKADEKFSWDDIYIDRESGLVRVDGEELE
jgi:hypothetical protein